MNKNCTRLLCCTALLALSWALPSRAQERAPLQVAVPQSLSPPFVLWRNGLPVAGVDLDIARAIATQLKVGIEFKPLPRLRIDAALSSGEADLACNLSPLGNARSEGLLAGPVLFELQEMLAGHDGVDAVDSLEQLPAGSSVGTLQGQTYAALEPLFLAGRVKRDDALDDERMLRKLVLARHRYGVSSRQSMGWFANQDGVDKLASWRLPLGNRGYRCTVSPRARIDPRQIIVAMEQLQASGRVDQIVASYTSPPLAVVVSNRSAVQQVTRSALTELYLGQRSRLADGSAPEPAMAAGLERKQFMDVVLKRDAAQFRAAWAAQEFGGRRRPPVELAGAETMKAHLQRHIGAIGFLPLSLVDSSLRIVYLP